MSLYVEVQYRGDWWGEDPITETVWDTPGDLFRSLSGRGGGRPWEALGRCTGKVYVDMPGSPCTLCGMAKNEHEYNPQTNRIRVENIELGQHYYQAKAQQVGWIFVARNPAPVNRGDEQPTGLREAWVTVHTAEPDVTVTRVEHYADLGRL